MQCLRPPAELYCEKLPSVPPAWIAGARAIRTTAAAQTLDQRAAHHGLETQRAQLLAQVTSATLSLQATGRHI